MFEKLFSSSKDDRSLFQRPPARRAGSLSCALRRSREYPEFSATDRTTSTGDDRLLAPAGVQLELLLNKLKRLRNLDQPSASASHA